MPIFFAAVMALLTASALSFFAVSSFSALVFRSTKIALWPWFNAQ
jgi:hypothetical protein